MPRVSVLTPVYNTNESHLRACIESILAQTFTDFEFLILDNGSDAYVADIVKSYHDTRIKYIRRVRNAGPAAGRNVLLDRARGEYIAFMDSDDVALPTRFASQVTYLDKNPDIGVVASDVEIIGDTTWKKHQIPSDDAGIKHHFLFNGCAFFHSSVMARHSVIDENNIRYRADMVPAEDYVFWLDLLPVTRFACMPEILTQYRYHTGNTSYNRHASQWHRSIVAQMAAIEKYYDVTIQDKDTLVGFYMSENPTRDMLVATEIALDKNRGIPCAADFMSIFRNKMRILFYHTHRISGQWTLMTSGLAGYLGMGRIWCLFCFITRGIL